MRPSALFWWALWLAMLVSVDVRSAPQARVALVPGAPRWFGAGSAGHVRICFATSRGILQQAFDRMEPVVKELAASRRQAKGISS